MNSKEVALQLKIGIMEKSPAIVNFMHQIVE